MERKAKIRMFGEVTEGQSQRTGNCWKKQTLILELPETDGTQSLMYWDLFNDRLLEVQNSGLGVGDELIVDIRSTNRLSTNGRQYTEWYIKSWRR